MDFSKKEIVDALGYIKDNNITSNDNIIKAIRNNILEGKIEENDVQSLINKIYPSVIDEEGNEINTFTLFDEEFLNEKGKLDAEKYLKSTDWIIVKIGELQLLGEAVNELLEKYSEELAERKKCRELL